MEASDEQQSSLKENGVKDDEKTQKDEEAESVATVKHLEENELFSQYYLVCRICCTVLRFKFFFYMLLMITC